MSMRKGTFAANLGHIARFIAEIYMYMHVAIFSPRAENVTQRRQMAIFVHEQCTSITCCVYSDPCPCGFVATRDVGQGKKVTAW